MAGRSTGSAATGVLRLSPGKIRARLARAPVIPLAILATVTFAGIFAPFITPYDPGALDLALRLTPPAWQEGGDLSHVLGTDGLGRDVLARVIYGARISLIVAAVTVTVAGTIGVTLGILAGYFGGLLDTVVMRTVDIFISVPSLLLAISLAGVLNPGLQNVLIILVLFNWAGFARLTRGETLALKQRDFIKLAQVVGCSPMRMLIRHIFPNILNVVVVLATLDVGRVIIFEASLSFLGLGVQNPTPAWGNMLASGREYIRDAWWLATFPGVALLLTALAANLSGDWLRDALDPKLRQV